MPQMSLAKKAEYNSILSLFDKVDPYLEPISLNRPWYMCICASNIEAEPHALTIRELEPFQVFDIIEHYYGNGVCIADRTSRRAGYIPQGEKMHIIPYRGRWGAGWILATPYNSTTVVCKYCILSDGGMNHGNRKEG